MVKEITVKFDVSEEQVQRLMQLLPYWQQYIGNDGRRPCADWTIDDLFQSVIQAASIVLGRPLTSKEVKEFLML